MYSSLLLWLETTTRARSAPSPDNIASKFGQYERVPKKFTTAKNIKHNKKSLFTLFAAVILTFRGKTRAKQLTHGLSCAFIESLVQVKI